MAKATKINRGRPALTHAQRVSTGKDRRLTTTITFTSDDLSALARYVGAGQVLLQTNPTEPQSRSKIRA